MDSNHQSIRHECLPPEMPDLRQTPSNAEVGSDDLQKPISSSESQFRAVFEGALDAMVIADDLGKCLEVNPAACQLFGLSQAELVGCSIADFAAPGFDFKCAWEAFQQQGQTMGEFRLLRPDGAIRIVEYSATANFLPNRHLSVLRDITERKQIADSLKQERHLNSAVIATMASLVVVLDRQGRIIRFNKACEQTTGYSFDEVRNQPFWDLLLLAEEVEPVKAAFQQLSAGLLAQEFTNYWLTKEGNRRLIAWSNTILLTEAGTVEYIIGTGIDITQQHQAGEELKRQDLQLRSLNEIALKIRQSLQPEEILHTTVTEVQNLLNTNRVIVYRLWVDGTGSAVAEAVSPGCLSLLDQTFPEELFPIESYQEYLQGKICTIEDVKKIDLTPYRLNFLQQFGVQAKVVVPIILKQQLWGLLIVHQCDHPRSWSNFEIQLLKQLADQVSVALAQAQLIEALRQSEERYALAIQGASHGIWDWNLKTDHIYYSPHCKALLGYQEDEIGSSLDEWFSRVHPEDQERAMAELTAHLNGLTLTFESEQRLLHKNGTYRWMISRGLAIKDADGEISRMAGSLTDISDRKQVEILLRRYRHHLEEMVAERTSELTNTNQQLQQEIAKHQKTEAELSLRNQELLTLEKISQIALNTQSLNTAYQEIIEEISLVTGFESASIELYDETRQKMVFVGMKNCLLPPEVKILEVPVTETLSGLVVSTGQPLIESNAWARSEYANEILRQQGVQTFVCVPMIVNQRVIGALGLGHREPLHLSDRFPEWVATLANHVASLTERKRAEEAFRRSEQRFRLLVEYAADAFFVHDLAGRFVEVNQHACDSLGYTREELLALSVADIDPTCVLSMIVDVWTQMLAGQAITLNGVHTRKDGTTFPVEVRVGLFESEEDQLIVALARDITERKQAEFALQQQTERERLIARITQHIRQSLNLKKILNTTVAEVQQFLQADRVIIYDFQLDWNGSVVAESVAPDYLSMLGCLIHDPLICDQHYIELYQQGQSCAITDIHTSGLEQNVIELLTFFQIRAKLLVPILQGQQLWGLLIVHQCSAPRQWQPLEIDLLKQLAAQVGIAIQQSELYQQVRKLNRSLETQVEERTAQLQQALNLEAALKRITDKVRDSLDENQILQTTVQELGQLLGVDSCSTALYNLEERISIINYEYTISLPSSEGQIVKMTEAPDIYPQLLQGQHLQFCEIAANSLQAAFRKGAILACPISDDQGILGDLWLSHQPNYSFNELETRLVQQVANQCAIALRQARLYKASLAQVEELEKLNHLKDDFLSTVSHELRTPLSNIKMATQMLEVVLEREGILNAEHHKAARYFQILNDECQREITLINDLLDLSRLEAGTEPLMLTMIDLHSWIPCVLEPFVERAYTQEQHLQVDIPPELPPLISDLSDIGRIVTELVSNACKYTPPGGTITVSASATREVLHLSVSNSGVEIPSGELAHIFDKFYRIPNNDPWKHGGTGLGLALVKRLVEHLGGTIQVESARGQTTFLLQFPLNANSLN